MAVGRRWTEDETRQALELYQHIPFGRFHAQTPEIIELARLIGRTPDSVAMKLSNFASLDPKITGSGRRGLAGASDLDRKVWAEFHAVLDEPVDETSALPSGRVWTTSFWGFNPEIDGYLGFTREGDRAAFLRQWREGDLVMIYVTLNQNAEPEERGRVLGFLEVEPRPIRDTERMSPEGISWKVRNGLTNRWTNAVPVLRAWRAVNPPLVRDIAPTTLAPGTNFQLIASRGQLLLPDEAERALSIPVRPVQAYGGVTITAEEARSIYTPSKGFPMSFGKRSFETKDGAHFLYALKLDGDVQAIMNEPSHLLRGKIVVKVGLAKDPEQRLAQHNACLPPAGKLRWKLMLRSKSLQDGATALEAEDSLKKRFAETFRSLGGEFFLCDEKTLPGEFAQAQRPRRSS